MTQYVLSLSYGKDSLACLGAIEKLGLPLDRIVHAEVWATDTIPADLPPMVEFKAKADAIIKERYGITVEHISAVERDGYPTSDSFTKSGLTKSSTKNVSTDSLWCEERGVIQGSKLMSSTPSQKATYERLFYRKMVRSKTGQHKIYGFPHTLNGGWCHRLKDGCFLKAPLHKELIQILCNISELQPMNQNESHGIPNRVSYSPWWKLVGTKPIADSGVKKTICYRLFTPIPPVAVAGSVTIKVWIS